MTKSELDKWAKRINLVLASNEEFVLSTRESGLFSLKDLMYLFQHNNISCMKDYAGNIKFVN